MKKLALLMLFLMIMLSTRAMATTQIRPIDVEMSIDFTDKTAFKLILPGGTEKLYSWDSNDTHTDETFTHKIYHEYDEEEWCSSYSDISSKISSFDNKLNKTIECTTAQSERNEYKRVKEIEEELRFKFESQYNKCQNESDAIEDEKDICESSLNTMRNAQSELSTCKKDLTDCEKSNQNTLIFSSLVGIGIGYLIWGRKNKKGPSEQAEAGSYGDAVNYRDEGEADYNEPPYE